MDVLLDTNVALWALKDEPLLGDAARKIVADPANRIFLSVVSVWEVAIKSGLNRRRSGAIGVTSREFTSQAKAAGIHLLPLRPEHAFAVEDLPHVHGDPFDRLLVAQALTEPLRLLTADRTLAHYSQLVIPA